MVTNLISGLTQGFPEIIFPNWSPQSSPSSPKGFFPVVAREKHFFMEFSCLDEPLGRIVIKALEGAGQAGLEFESLVTGQEGFGYKGSRVYACCKDEWCLLGDLLYQEPRAQKSQNTDWDPRLPEGQKEEEDEGGGEGSSYRQLYRRSRRVVRTQSFTRAATPPPDWPFQQVVTKQSDMRGAVVAVTTDYDLDTRTWTLGPQIKICLSDSLLRCDCVLGTVTEGMEVAQKLSRMGGKSYEPEVRITISNCGAL